MSGVHQEDGGESELQKKIEELQVTISEQGKELERLKDQGTEGEANLPRAQPADTGLEVTSIQEGDITLRRLVQRIAMILQAEKILIMFYERESGDLIAIPPAYGLEDGRLEVVKVRATQGISGQVFREGEPVIFHNASTDPRTRKELISLLHITNGITVPLIIERRDDENRVIDRSTIGVLHAFNKRHDKDFNDEDVRLLERMAKNVSSIIANLQLYREVLEEREELLQTFESLTSGLLLVSPEGKISQMNAQARLAFKIEGEIAGKTYRELIKHQDVIDFIESGLGGVEKGQVEFTVDFHGAERTYSVQGAIVRNEDGKTLGFVTIFNDVTEQKNLDRMKSSFVAMASHELRTPLTAIKGFSSTLLDGVDDDVYNKEDQKEFLNIVVSECDRLRRLIDDLLNTARIESGESLRPNYSEFQLQTLVDKVAMVQSQASHKHKVVIQVHDVLPATIVGDEDKLDQIFTNLLNNAIKYSPDGGIVTIHAKVEGDDVLFGIEDQGIGIPPDQLNKVFERFHRVNNEDNRKIYGTGLGLFLVKHLVEHVHQGQIWAESEIGKGSIFWFRIPQHLDIEKANAMND